MRDAAPFTTDAVTEDEIPGVAYTKWDADKLFGCVCDRYFYTGYYEHDRSRLFGSECRRKACVFNDDPRTEDQVPEIQVVHCKGVSGGFIPRFRNTEPGQQIFADDDYDRVKYVLELIPAVSFIDFSMNDTVACGDPWATEMVITFVADHGDLPLMRADTGGLDGSVDVYEAQAGTKEAIECSNRGHCDYNTGRCICGLQYGSSDGNGATGRLGDCGNNEALWQFGQENMPYRLRTNNSNFAF